MPEVCRETPSAPQTAQVQVTPPACHPTAQAQVTAQHPSLLLVTVPDTFQNTRKGKASVGPSLPVTSALMNLPSRVN
jgi:hypothetical protein